MKRDSSIYDLAVEFSKVFGDIKGLDDFIMNVMSNIPNAENIMSVKKIRQLPESEEEILKRISKKIEKEKEEADVTKEETKIEVSKKDKAEEGEELAETSIDIQVKKEGEKEWTPEIPPEKAPIRVEEYKYTHEEGKETEITDEEVKLSDRKSATRSHRDWERSIEVLSKKAKEDIGRWGEEYAYRCVKDEMTKKYPDTSLLDTEQGFKLEKDGRVIVEVVWLNKNGESGQHYDIKITENKDEIFIEVKSTKEDEKALFQVSKDQWRLMKEKGNKFYIYRVYGAGTERVKLEKIPNPAKLWKEGKIEAYPICIVL